MSGGNGVAVICAGVARRPGQRPPLVHRDRKNARIAGPSSDPLGYPSALGPVKAS